MPPAPGRPYQARCFERLYGAPARGRSSAAYVSSRRQALPYAITHGRAERHYMKLTGTKDIGAALYDAYVRR